MLTQAEIIETIGTGFATAFGLWLLSRGIWMPMRVFRVAASPVGSADSGVEADSN